MSDNAAPPIGAKDPADPATGLVSFLDDARHRSHSYIGTDRLPWRGFVHVFVTADDRRVMAAAFIERQFAGLVEAAGLTCTFAFLERLLQADFSDCADLHAHRDTIAVLLTAWFSRCTVADLAMAFTGTAVLWAPLQKHSGQSGRRNVGRGT